MKPGAKKIYLVFIWVVILVLTFFTVNNFLAVSKLQSQTKTIIANIPGGLKSASDLQIIESQEDLLLAFEEWAAEAPQELRPTLTDSGQLITYSNIFSEAFYSQYYLNQEETNLHFDDQVSALTFEPIYELVLKEDCATENCNLKNEQPEISLEKNGWRFLGRSLALPAELKGKSVQAVFANKLDKKYLVSFIVSEDEQEVVFSYFSDNLGRLNYLDTASKMRTTMGYGNGYVSAGGSDEQFIIFYSGYESLALLYNEGQRQDLKSFFDLRVTGGGFASKVFKIGRGSKAIWYICSVEPSRHFLKLWQNGGAEVQGLINLGEIFEGQFFVCALEKDQLYLVSAGKKYRFDDRGFDNSHEYQYQSNNINSYKDKKVQQLHILGKSIKANPDDFTFSASFDGQNWQETTSDSLNFTNRDSDQLFLRLNFKAKDNYYSPWFGGLENVFYIAID
jgi:hypothetical protein